MGGLDKGLDGVGLMRWEWVGMGICALFDIGLELGWKASGLRHIAGSRMTWFFNMSCFL